MNTNFKTALFGGFDREDVVNYIQQISRENQQRVSALEEENHGLQERNRAGDHDQQAEQSDTFMCFPSF